MRKVASKGPGVKLMGHVGGGGRFLQLLLNAAMRQCDNATRQALAQCLISVDLYLKETNIETPGKQTRVGSPKCEGIKPTRVCTFLVNKYLREHSI